MNLADQNQSTTDAMTRALQAIQPASDRVCVVTTKLQAFYSTLQSPVDASAMGATMKEFAGIIRELRESLDGLTAHSAAAADACTAFESDLRAAIRLQTHSGAK